MKRIISVSLGSSARDHKVEAKFLGERFSIERVGTDGDMNRAIEMIRSLDGKVDAFGMGGIDLYLVADGRRYMVRDAGMIARAARITPIVDGSGLKDTLERRVAPYLQQELGWQLAGKKTLLVSGVDRFGLAESLTEAGCRMTFGDLIFALGIPIPIRSLGALRIIARLLLPVMCQLPFEILYPTGKKQDTVTTKYEKHYLEADIIAGDFLFIKKYMPPALPGKIIITNTTTASDVEMLRQRGVATLVTTTPEMEGRSFGTNVMEGVLISMLGKSAAEVRPGDYGDLLDKLAFKPRVLSLGA